MPPPKLQSVVELPLPTGIRADESAGSGAIAADVLALFDECAPALLRYVRSFGLSPQTAEDILQDVCLSLFRHLQLGRPRSNLKGWMFEVAHNLALKQRQRGWKQQQAECDWDAALPERIADPAANPEQLLAEDQRRRRLRSVLKAMPERDRQCLGLRAAGLRYRDIARTLGISLGSVAKSLTRAIVRLTIADKG